jgi:hypothetical protein
MPTLETVCEVRFTLPDELAPCQAKAKVVWLRSEGPNTKKGVGLAFEPLSADTEHRVLAYLKRFQDLASDVDFQS